MSLGTRQNAELVQAILDFLDEEAQPEDVFSDRALIEWAEEQGYTKTTEEE